MKSNVIDFKKAIIFLLFSAVNTNTQDSDSINVTFYNETSAAVTINQDSIEPNSSKMVTLQKENDVGFYNNNQKDSFISGKILKKDFNNKSDFTISAKPYTTELKNKTVDKNENFFITKRSSGPDNPANPLQKDNPSYFNLFKPDKGVFLFKTVTFENQTSYKATVNKIDIPAKSKSSNIFITGPTDVDFYDTNNNKIASGKIYKNNLTPATQYTVAIKNNQFWITGPSSPDWNLFNIKSFLGRFKNTTNNPVTINSTKINADQEENITVSDNKVRVSSNQPDDTDCDGTIDGIEVYIGKVFDISFDINSMNIKVDGHSMKCNNKSSGNAEGGL